MRTDKGRSAKTGNDLLYDLLNCKVLEYNGTYYKNILNTSKIQDQREHTTDEFHHEP